MISGIIMASGFSRRFNQNKLLINIKGIPLIERVIQAANNSDLDEVIIIYRSPEIKKIADKYQIKSVFNTMAHAGQSAAVKLGVNTTKANSLGYLFMVGDQPFITSDLINRVINEYKYSQASIIIPTYGGKQGNPVLFSSKLKAQLMKVEGDKGGRSLFKDLQHEVKFLEVEDEKIGIDIDTEKDYEEVKSEEVKSEELRMKSEEVKSEECRM
ncbi:molybdenum cofactor cytidylyltransferase [Alkaliphilus peptidifermentans]|uniref:Molybdenum cofactor cytidylyltransferase n=1 Tax=Alkaliphilus peptidifermentans DSM 18978 TaxID=1120976 RepID=A0A1G5KYD4_9FIRM|nr:molybdenum cofactor cytidylyltransferase [Alkaliphilus peptidifermentans]SCZ05354.1 molybdenum cofactor cytidylyltransferase [Alkaliphilus peptidifermentans DSM 18978]